ncbi:hypothetical protein [Micromonospora sp. NPDC048169]|uniref:hypothetical protein n=1 Tax=Micromonospora sp. NPDC048169 TaxID=3154711 RepID=UPI0033C12FD0
MDRQFGELVLTRHSQLKHGRRHPQTAHGPDLGQCHPSIMPRPAVCRCPKMSAGAFLSLANIAAGWGWVLVDADLRLMTSAPQGIDGRLDACR